MRNPNLRADIRDTVPRLDANHVNATCIDSYIDNRRLTTDHRHEHLVDIRESSALDSSIAAQSEHTPRSIGQQSVSMRLKMDKKTTIKRRFQDFQSTLASDSDRAGLGQLALITAAIRGAETDFKTHFHSRWD